MLHVESCILSVACCMLHEIYCLEGLDVGGCVEESASGKSDSN